MGEEWCTEHLKSLEIVDRRTTALNELKSHLITKGKDDAAIYDQVLSSKNLFECLNETNSEDSTLACDVLAICMSNLELEKSIQNTNLLGSALTHHNPKVQALGCVEISRILRNCPNGIKDVNLVISLIDCLKSEELNVSLPCIPILVQLLPQFLDISTVMSRFLGTLDAEASVKCRSYEIAVKIAKVSADRLNHMDGVLEKAVADLESTDILFQLNMIEILSELAENDHGLLYLENKGVFTKLLKEIEQISQNPLSNFVIPGLMKFYARIATKYPEKVFEQFPQVIFALFECLVISLDYTILPTALDTLGVLARSRTGKIFLENTFGPQMKQTLHDMGANIQNLPTDLKIRILECLDNVFYTNPEENDNQVACITESWYKIVSQNDQSLQFVFKYIQNPFPDIKGASYSLLKTLCHVKWGHERLNKTGGLIEYLLDRSTESDKDLKIVKYEIICLLAESNVFPPRILVQLKSYVSEGAFFVRGMTEVAVEGAQ
ncbi:26S proteasome non-ATPase regulatory subunit 5 [Culicoides brevitarsis]|uniref:26S proteasome non-ATPase regulatory subunit 5 n=1 Tax=Culicoides brevitarsis TaxID=469753 RepID=UPI00307C910D